MRDGGGELAPSRPSRSWRRLARIAIWVGGVTLLIAVLDLLGVPASEWIRELSRKVGEIPPWALVAGIVLQTAQTSLAKVKSREMREKHKKKPTREAM